MAYYSKADIGDTVEYIPKIGSLGDDCNITWNKPERLNGFICHFEDMQDEMSHELVKFPNCVLICKDKFWDISDLKVVNTRLVLTEKFQGSFMARRRKEVMKIIECERIEYQEK